MSRIHSTGFSSACFALFSLAPLIATFFVFACLFVAKLAGRLLPLDLAGAVELGAGFNHKLTHVDRARHDAAGHDLESLGIHRAGKAATDHHLAGHDIAIAHTLLSDGDLGIALDLALDVAVDM